VTTRRVATAWGGPEVLQLQTVELGPPGPVATEGSAYRFANFHFYSTPMDVDGPR
jgi:hypothetical protein